MTNIDQLITQVRNARGAGIDHQKRQTHLERRSNDELPRRRSDEDNPQRARESEARLREREAEREDQGELSDLGNHCGVAGASRAVFSACSTSGGV